MTETAQVDWKSIDEDPRFQALHRKKTAFLWGLMVFSMIYYFLLPIGAAYFQELFKIKVGDELKDIKFQNHRSPVGSLSSHPRRLS